MTTPVKLGVGPSVFPIALGCLKGAVSERLFESILYAVIGCKHLPKGHVNHQQIFVGLLTMSEACGHPGTPVTDSPVNDDVQACLDAVDQERTFYCTGTSHQCLYSALRPFCMGTRAAFIQGVFHCLTLDGQACPTPSDPSNGQECINELISMSATDQDKALGAAICSCESTPESGCAQDLPETSLATFLFMEESDITTLTNCLMTMGCGGSTACADVSPLSAALTCGD